MNTVLIRGNRFARLMSIAAGMISIALLVPEARGTLIVFAGRDSGATAGSSWPNSAAAAAGFDAAADALGSIQLMDMENLQPGRYANIDLAPDVHAGFFGLGSGSNVNNSSQSQITGFNTTVGGSTYLRLAGASPGPPSGVTFDFDTPIQAFGAYFTGVGTSSGDFLVRFTDGNQQAFQIDGGTQGGVDFFGFTDAGASIRSVTAQLENGLGDVVGIDDIRIVHVPEPAALAILSLGVFAAALRKVRRH